MPIEVERKKKSPPRLYSYGTKRFIVLRVKLACTDRGLSGLKVVWKTRWLEILIALDRYYNFACFLSGGSSDFSKTTYLWTENRVI